MPSFRRVDMDRRAHRRGETDEDKRKALMTSSGKPWAKRTWR